MRLSQHFLKIIFPVHIITILMFFYFTVNWYLVLVGWILISGFGIAIGFHRYLSHKSFITNKIWHYVLIILGCLGGQGSPLFWAALHRGNHHKFTDTIKDFHSPVNGMINSYIMWQVNFNPKLLPIMAAKDLSKCKFIVWTHSNYNKLIWLTIASIAVFDLSVLLSLLLIPMIISMHQENLINLFCHLKTCGYRNFDTQDNSVNNWILGVLFWGHGYHNNHHAQPWKYNYGTKWYEIDIAALLIKYIIKQK